MCQLRYIDEMTSYSWFARFLENLRWKLRFFKRSVVALVDRPSTRGSRPKETPTDISGDTPIGVGDIVRVRSETEISPLLDENKRYKGCPFSDQMYQYCGQEFKVVKQVEFFYDEVKMKLCRCKDLFILNGVVCNGKKRLYLHPCQLNCFFFWHKDFLQKV